MKRKEVLVFLAGVMGACLVLPGAARTEDEGAEKPAPAPVSEPQAKDSATRKRVAVLAFEFGTIRRWWSGDWELGRGVSDLVVTQLVKDGNYRVIERQAIDAVLQEQELGASGRVDAKTAAKIGGVLGVDAIIIGSITQFDFETKKKGLGALGGVVGSGLGVGGLDKSNTKATVIIDARLIDTTSAEILAVAQGKGESRRGSFKASAFGLGGRAVGGVKIDMGSSDFQATILGEATRKSVESVCTQLVASQGKVVGKKFELKGRVADIEGNKIILNLGAAQGLKVGDVLIVEHVVREVKDPDTGEVLRSVTEPVGTVTITEVDEKSSVGTFEGKSPPTVGDRVKTK
jgi:curli biogenesis system outer membrane secretion channel CsgG